MKSFQAMCVVGLVTVVGCGGDSAKALEQKYERLKMGMTKAQVTEIMGPGKSVTIDEIKAYPEFPTLNPRDAPADTQWTRWGEGIPYVLAGMSKDKVVLVRIFGVGPSKR